MLVASGTGGSRFECPVHGHVTLDDPCAMAIVNTPEFQRLRELRQLGLTHYVFPSAEHTRL